MTPEQLKRAYGLFVGALARPREVRHSVLEKECGSDRELLSYVLRVLKQEEAESEDGRLSAAPSPLRRDERLGTSIGPYLLRDRLGEGGQGIVYFATRQEDFKQRVAVKVLKRGVDTEEVVARFRGERQRLAALAQENIARLFDGGDTEDGLPYFAMEYVQGLHITAYCNRKALPPKGILTLFQKVCTAVSYVHGFGLIHRDLKPANILVTADGTPKILDFGIAKALSTELGNVTTVDPRNRFLSPRYASPEQMRGEKVLSVKTDVYSLGVVLWELLAGRSPYGGSLSRDELRDRVLEGRIQAPSSVSDSVRRKQIPRDLDAICLKALDHEPANRYASVEKLSNDIERFLNDLPVKAKRHGPVYRFRKFLRRNRALAVGSFAAFLFLILGLTTTTIQYLNAQKNLGRANTAESEMKVQLAESLAQRGVSLAQRGKWREALDAYSAAIEHSHSASALLRIESALMLDALNEEGRAEEQLSLVRKYSMPREVEARLLLAEAGIMLKGSKGVEEAEKKLVRALSLELPPAATAYAQALLSVRSDDALQHLDLALRADPFNHRAHTDRLLLLATLGRIPEAIREADGMIAAFPEDVLPRLYSGIVNALLGNSSASTKVFAELEATFGEKTFRALRELSESVIKVVENIDNPLLITSLKVDEDALRNIRSKIVPEVESLGTTIMRLRCVREVMRRSDEAEKLIEQERPSSRHARLEVMQSKVRRLMEVLPSTGFYYIDGELSLGLAELDSSDEARRISRLSDALQSFDRAVGGLAYFPKMSLEVLLKKSLVETTLSRFSPPGSAESIRLARRARDDFDAALRTQGVSVKSLMPIVRAASDDYELDRHFIVELRSLEDSPEKWQLLAEHELRHGRPDAALKTVAEARKAHPAASGQFAAIEAKAQEELSAIKRPGELEGQK